jgi:hypothetical protein
LAAAECSTAAQRGGHVNGEQDGNPYGNRGDDNRQQDLDFNGRRVNLGG